MRIAIESPDQPEIIRLIEELDDYQKPMYPPESHHGIDIPALTRDNVLFAVIREDAATAIGCGAVVVNGTAGGGGRGEQQRRERRGTHTGGRPH